MKYLTRQVRRRVWQTAGQPGQQIVDHVHRGQIYTDRSEGRAHLSARAKRLKVSCILLFITYMFFCLSDICLCVHRIFLCPFVFLSDRLSFYLLSRPWISTTAVSVFLFILPFQLVCFEGNNKMPALKECPKKTDSARKKAIILLFLSKYLQTPAQSIAYCGWCHNLLFMSL